MKNIHILPTDKPSRLQKNRHNKLFFSKEPKFYSDCINQNIYITNDEEIKEGDYFYQSFDSIIHKCYKLTDNYVIAEKPSDYPKKICKKIILTTDQDLIKNGVQAIDDEFLEWFVKNPSCEEIYVNKIESFDFEINKYVYNYKIIIPKEEPKIKSFENAKSFFINKIDKAIENSKQEQDKKLYSEEEVKEIIKLSCEEGMLIQRTINDKVKIPYIRIKDFTIRMFEQFKKR